jgi:predicted RNase H-like HicB family nuclease
MVNTISIVISKNPDGYSVNFPELEPIDYQDSSLDGVLNRLKDALETHLISSELPSEGKEIMKFAGIWEDLPEEDFRNFCEEVEQRRQNSSSRRFSDETLFT